MTVSDEASTSFETRFFSALACGDELYAGLCEALREKSFKVATVESCTGGLLASRIVDIAGSSDVYWGSAISYSRDAKAVLAGVTDIAQLKEVSADCAVAMLRGLQKKAKLPCAMSVTGYAELRDGSGGKAYAAFIAADKQALVHVRRVAGSRNEVRGLLADIMAAFLLALLGGELPKTPFVLENQLFSCRVEGPTEKW